MAYLTDDKRHLILKCKNCGGEVSYRTDYPFASRTIQESLEAILAAWQEKAELCIDCLYPGLLGPIGATNVEPQPQVSDTVVPQSPEGGEADENPQESPSFKGPLAPKDHTPPRLYDVKECQALLRMSHGRTLKFIREEIIPTGGCVRLGNRYLVHAWAINYALSQRTLPPTSKQTYSPARLAGLKPFRLKSKMTRSLPTSSEKQS